MSQASEQIASQYSTAAGNRKAWYDVVFNVKDPAYGAKGDGVTDDTAAIQAAIDAAKEKGGVVYMPAGPYVVTGNISIENCELRGVGVGESGIPYNDKGTIIQTRDTTKPMFRVGRGASFVGLNFFYPDQNGSTVNPIVYPPTLKTRTDSLANIRIDQCTFINPYIAMDFGNTTYGAGRIEITDVQAYAVKTFMKATNMLDVVQLNNIMITRGVYQDVTNTGNQYLGKWTQENGTAFEFYSEVDGFSIDQGLVFGYRKGMVVADAATVDMLSVVNVKWDQVTKPLDCVFSGVIRNTVFSDCVFISTNILNNTYTDKAINIQGTGNTGSLILTNNVFSIGAATYVDYEGNGIQEFIITGNVFKYWGQATGLNSDQYAIAIGTANCFGTIADNVFINNYPNGVGIYILTTDRINIEGNIFKGCKTPVIVSGGHYVVTGNSSLGTTGTKSLQASGYTSLVAGINNWDKNTDASPSVLTMIDFPNIAPGSANIQTVSVPGARGEDSVCLGLPAVGPQGSGLILQAWVSANDVVSVQAINFTGVAIDPAPAQFRIAVLPRG